MTAQQRTSITLTLISLACVIMYLSNIKRTNDDVINNIKVDPSVLMVKETSMATLEHTVMNLPDGPLKACMLTCIAATYSGDIESLNVIIMEYNRLKLLELKHKDQI